MSRNTRNTPGGSAQPPTSRPRPNTSHRTPQGANTTGTILPKAKPYGKPAGRQVQPQAPPPDERSFWDKVWDGMKKRGTQMVYWEVGQPSPPHLEPQGGAEKLGAGLMDVMEEIGRNPRGRGRGSSHPPQPRPRTRKTQADAPEPQEPPDGSGGYVLGDGREGRCKLRPYKEMKKICGEGMDAHHVLPDRAFRTGTRRSDERLASTPSMDQGLTICLQSNKGGLQAEHTQAHIHYDKAEKLLAADPGSAKGLTALGKAEALAAESVEAATKGQCTKEDIEQQLRNHHEKKFKLKRDVLIRATKRLPSGEAKQQMGTIRRTRYNK